jgi:hypothetical protein
VRALAFILASSIVVACRASDGGSPPPPPSPGSQCPGAPGCGCRNETGEVACELVEVKDMPSPQTPGQTMLVAKYTSAARPGSTGFVQIDVAPPDVAAARAFFDAHKSATCHFDFTSAPCPPSDLLTPLIPKFADSSR